MCKYLIFFLLLSGCLAARGDSIEIRYHAPDATQVTMVWGVDDWGTTAIKPAGTIIKDGVMQSPMIKADEDYVLKLTAPHSSIINCLFFFTDKAGPFKARIDYLDENEKRDKKFYHITAKGNAVIRIISDINKLKPYKSIKLSQYYLVFFFAFTTLAILLYLGKKFIFKTPFASFNPTALFFSISFTLLVSLLIIRAIITNEFLQFLIAPLHTWPLLFKTSFQDLLYTGILTCLFGLLFFIKRINQTLILYLFAGFAVLSLAIGIININITALLGRPFNYQWLYYSDFLLSADAVGAMKNNIDMHSILTYLIMLLSAVPLAWLLYYCLIKNPVVTTAIFAICFIAGYFVKNDPGVDDGKKANPVIYFVSSLWQGDAVSIAHQKNIDVSEFTKKNKNVLQPGYALKFKAANIKNVIVFVMESTPAEYITPYNSVYQSTPFLDSIKSSSLIFDAAYAHQPATNSEMVSFLCGSYPYLSYKVITAEKPAIAWPSISSELKKNGYRTSFFNSGDNGYLGADSFLRHRGFDEIKDFKQKIQGASVFLGDPRHPDENLGGINDSYLPGRFFNWIKNDWSTPFFSMMWTYQTHYPYYTTDKKIDFHVGDKSLQRYLNALHDADDALRQLVAGLKKRGLLNSTLIVVLGDHGESFGQHGLFGHAGGIYEGAVHIPLIFINPQLFNGGHITELAGISDIAPSIFSILNKTIPDEWQGEDLFSINRRNKVYFFDAVCSRFGCREGDYKLIYDASTNISYLYNVKNDPHETVNIAGDNPKYVKELNKDLSAWINYQVQYVNSYLK